jgi:endonuclease G
MKTRLLTSLLAAGLFSISATAKNLNLSRSAALPSSHSRLQAIPKEPARKLNLPPVEARDKNLAMGNPSAATTDPRNEHNYLMRKPEYVLSYNNGTGTPNWVSWHLNASWMGGTGRKNDFRPDPDLPKGWFSVLPRDYANSGFDRGHMCNSSDRTRDEQTNSATFLMTNMIPQAPQNNQHTWEQLESYSRMLAHQGRELFIVSGPAGKGGEGKSGRMDKIAVKRGNKEAAIVVPAVTWKVILVLPQGKTSPKNVTADTPAIAVIMPNTQDIDLDWKRYIVTVDAVEELTHLDFFTDVDPEVAAEIEQRTYRP